MSILNWRRCSLLANVFLDWLVLPVGLFDVIQFFAQFLQTIRMVVLLGTLLAGLHVHGEIEMIVNLLFRWIFALFGGC